MTIVRDDKMGGDARIEGHRIAVYHIVQYREAGFEPEEIADEFGINQAEVEEALEWAREHPEKIDDDRSATEMLRAERERDKQKLDEKFSIEDDE